MRAILGCLLTVAGALFGAQEYVFPDINAWIAAAVVLAGLALLLRRPAGATGADHEDSCQTCRGAGTVYSDEYNDWRQTGPVKVIRELCPACEGSGALVG